VLAFRMEFAASVSSHVPTIRAPTGRLCQYRYASASCASLLRCLRTAHSARSLVAGFLRFGHIGRCLRISRAPNGCRQCSHCRRTFGRGETACRARSRLALSERRTSSGTVAMSKLGVQRFMRLEEPAEIRTESTARPDSIFLQLARSIRDSRRLKPRNCQTKNITHYCNVRGGAGSKDNRQESFRPAR